MSQSFSLLLMTEMREILIAVLFSLVLVLRAEISQVYIGNEHHRNSRNIWNYFFREKCIPELGCFNSGPPFFDIRERPLSLVPDDRDKIATKFRLFTRTHPDEPDHVFSNGNFSFWELFQADFDPSAPTKFVVPGYICRIAENWETPLKNELLRNDGSNVFTVDWTGGDGPLYEQAVANTRVVGAEIACFIKHLQELVGIKTESIHIIGHSLGSHIAGYAGKRLKNLGRITAMDPAGPYFTNVDPVVRLDRGDALFVDAIHTNAAPSRFSGFGTLESIAHFDFYPNGGHVQPGCKDMAHAILEFLSHPRFDREGLQGLQCSHSRAIQLFTSSIKNEACPLRGEQCDSFEDFKAGRCANSTGKPTYVLMGMEANIYAALAHKDRSLNFYLDTTDAEPFCVKK